MDTATHVTEDLEMRLLCLFASIGQATRIQVMAGL